MYEYVCVPVWVCLLLLLLLLLLFTFGNRGSSKSVELERAIYLSTYVLTYVCMSVGRIWPGLFAPRKERETGAAGRKKRAGGRAGKKFFFSSEEEEEEEASFDLCYVLRRKKEKR